MRMSGMIALVAGAMLISSPVLAGEGCEHFQSVQTKSSTTTVQSSQPVAKPVTKKEGGD